MGTPRLIALLAVLMVAAALVALLLAREVPRAPAAGPSEERAGDERAGEAGAGSHDRASLSGDLASAEIEVPAPTAPSQREAIDSRPRGRITGTVTDTAGAPIRTGTNRMVLEHEDGQQVVSSWSEQGTFDVGGLEYGRWVVSTLVSRFAPERAEVALSDGHRSAEVNFVLRALREVIVRLRDERGGPLGPRLTALGLLAFHAPSVEIGAEGEPSQIESGAGFVGPAGTSVGLPHGSSAWVSAISGGHTLRRVEVPGGVQRVDVSVDTTQLRALLAKVRLSVPPTLPAGAALLLAREPGGRLRQSLPGAGSPIEILCPAGAVDLAITAPGFALERRKLQLEAGALLDLGTIALQPGYTIRGQIRDARGTPLAAPLSIRRRAGGRDQELVELLADVRSDVNGRFTFDGLPAGEYSVTCTWGGPPALVTLPRTEPLEVVGEVPDVNARAGSRRSSR